MPLSLKRHDPKALPGVVRSRRVIVASKPDRSYNCSRSATKNAVARGVDLADGFLVHAPRR